MKNVCITVGVIFLILFVMFARYNYIYILMPMKTTVFSWQVRYVGRMLF